MQYENPQIPEGINNSQEHPLKELIILSVGSLFIITMVIFFILFSVEYTAKFIPFEYEQQLVSSIAAQYTQKTGSEQQIYPLY